MFDVSPETAPFPWSTLALPLVTVLVGIFFGQDSYRQEWLGRALWVATTVWALLVSAFRYKHGRRPQVVSLGTGAVVAGLMPWIGLVSTVAWLLMLLVLVLVSLLSVVTRGKIKATRKAFAVLLPAFTLACLSLTGTAVTCGRSGHVQGSPPWVALHKLATEDQDDRRSGCFLLNPARDGQRREAALQVLSSNDSLPPQAATDAGLLFLHGSSVAELALAHALFGLATAGGHASAAKLERAALDRLRLAQGLPQVYGTQWIYRN